MGQKTHPIGFRLGFNKNWISNWYDERHFAEKLKEDAMLRKYIHARLEHAAVAMVEIMRTTKRITITINTARPGIVIGKKGEEVDHLREEIRRLTKMDIQINV
ncbi:MAG: 30S ribosomal protein S3, partial [Candidatus Marinimicrobia bacterium CG_4_10_14_0_2_um_filter_48_9]